MTQQKPINRKLLLLQMANHIHSAALPDMKQLGTLIESFPSSALQAKYLVTLSHFKELQDEIQHRLLTTKWERL